MKTKWIFSKMQYVFILYFIFFIKQDAICYNLQTKWQYYYGIYIMNTYLTRHTEKKGVGEERDMLGFSG